MDERKKIRREQKEAEDLLNKRETPKIQVQIILNFLTIKEQFADLKRGLSAVTEDEWAK